MMRRPATAFILSALIAVALCAPAAAEDAVAPPTDAKPECPVCEKVRGVPVELDDWLAAAAAEPRRVFWLATDAAAPREVSYDEMLDTLSAARVVFLGENHDDTATHRLQLETLAALHCASACSALAMEQFERDVQPVLDSYLWGELDEQSFLKDSRPWGNYAEHYRALIEYCKAGGIAIIAGNSPTPVVRKVSREGWDSAWSAYSPQERAWLARESTHPRDRYWDNFKLAMGITPEVVAGTAPPDDAHGMGMSLEKAWAFYQAQCLKDDTMAESIADYLACNPGAQVVHTNGRFHSDYRLGTAQRTIERLRDCGDCDPCSVLVVSFVPVADLSALDWTDLEGAGDFVVFVQAPPQN
jgi:uncharacterized iron-regulated protein